MFTVEGRTGVVWWCCGGGDEVSSGGSGVVGLRYWRIMVNLVVVVEWCGVVENGGDEDSGGE